MNAFNGIRRPPPGKGALMSDVLYLALTVGFFAASVGLIHLFERLRERK